MPQLFKNELQSCLKLQVCIITTKIVMKSAKSRKPSSKPSWKITLRWICEKQIFAVLEKEGTLQEGMYLGMFNHL